MPYNRETDTAKCVGGSNKTKPHCLCRLKYCKDNNISEHSILQSASSKTLILPPKSDFLLSTTPFSFVVSCIRIVKHLRLCFCSVCY